jgi:hypothetical protein
MERRTVILGRKVAAVSQLAQAAIACGRKVPERIIATIPATIPMTTAKRIYVG